MSSARRYFPLVVIVLFSQSSRQFLVSKQYRSYGVKGSAGYALMSDEITAGDVSTARGQSTGLHEQLNSAWSFGYLRCSLIFAHRKRISPLRWWISVWTCLQMSDGLLWKVSMTLISCEKQHLKWSSKCGRNGLGQQLSNLSVFRSKVWSVAWFKLFCQLKKCDANNSNITIICFYWVPNDLMHNWTECNRCNIDRWIVCKRCRHIGTVKRPIKHMEMTGELRVFWILKKHNIPIVYFLLSEKIRNCRNLIFFT